MKALRFVPQVCEVRTALTHRPLSVMVAVGTGLGYAPLSVCFPNQPEGYHLIHVSSGWYLCRGPRTQAEAQTWIARLLPLLDWTQDETVIREVEWAFIQRVIELREEVIVQYQDYLAQEDIEHIGHGYGAP